MRVQLPSSPASPPPPADGSKAPQSTASPAVVQPVLWERLLTAATRWTVAVPVMLVCGAALCWALYFRLPASERLLKIHARANQPAAETNRVFTAGEVSSMRAQVQERSAALIQARKEIPPLLSKLDAKARELGWRCEASLKPPVAEPGGVRELTAHPVAFELRYDSVQPERAYHGLMAWLWTVSTLQPRAEVTALKLQSLAHGVNAAQVELSFFSLNPHEEHPPK
jgi:hypothetical protein